jgi:hypothetical protein
MAYDIPTRFHNVWSRHLREIERTKMCGIIIIMPLIKSPKQRLETYWFCSVSYYYYMHPDCCRVMYCYSMFLFQYYYYYSTHFCPLDFSEMPWSNIMKPCRNIICHVKLVF